MPEENTYITLHEAATRFGTRATLVKNYIMKGRVPVSFKIVDGAIYLNIEDLIKWTKRKGYILSTHNWYDAQKYRDIFDAVIGENRYLTYSKVRKFESHSGEEDYSNYWIYKAYVSKEEENMIRQLVRRATSVPNWTIQDYYK